MRALIKPLLKSNFRAAIKDALEGFTPLSLFSNGEDGIWLDPSDLSTLYQDSAMTIPVTSDGDPIGGIRDKSGNNNHATQSNDLSRPIYKTDGILHWIEFNGSRHLVMNQFITGTNDRSFITGYQSNKLSGEESFLFDACDRLLGGSGEAWGLSSEFDSLLVRVSGLAIFSPPQPVNNVNVATVKFGLSIGARVNSTEVRINGITSTLNSGNGAIINTKETGSSFLGVNSLGSAGVVGKVFSVISTTSLLSEENTVNAEGYIAAKSGVTI